MNPPWKLVALAFVLVGSVNTIDVASGDPGSPGLVGRSNAAGDSMLLLAALTTSDRDQARQLVAEAAALMDAFGGPGMALGEAAAKLRAALQVNPDEPAAHLELARLAMKSGGGLEPPTLAFAEASIRRALAIDPGYGNAFVLLGYVLTHGRRLKEADAAFVEAERAGATSPWLEYNIAELRERQGQSQVAAELMTQVAAAQAKSNGVRSSALQWLQQFHTYSFDYDQADLAYRRQIELKSDAPWPMGNYSRFLRVRRLDLAGSERYARQALAIMEYGMARDSLAATLYLQWAELRASGKNPERANALFAEAARLNPDLSELVSEIGYYPRAHPILDALVAKGISLDTLPGIAGGTTPLSIAAGNRSPALVSQMMTLGANPNTVEYAGRTPLMAAAQRGDAAMVRLLLNRGADPTLVANDGKDAERKAIENSQFPIANLLAAAKRDYVRPPGGLTPSVPFRTQTIYRVKKNFTNEQSSVFKQGEEMVFDSPTWFGDDKSARFVFKRADGGVREFIVEKNKISNWTEYFEEVGPAPAPLR